jgi:hypothetical protein
MSRQSTVSQTIRAAAEFCLADHLADGPLSADEVARRTRSAPCNTFRLLRAAATLDKDRPREIGGHHWGVPDSGRPEAGAGG